MGYPGDDKYLALAVAVSVSSVKINEQSVSIEQSIKIYWFAVTRPTHQNVSFLLKKNHKLSIYRYTYQLFELWVGKQQPKQILFLG